MKLGIIGLPQSGKTTLFNALSGQQEAVGDFSQAVHRAVIKVPDERLDNLATIILPKKVTHAEIEFLSLMISAMMPKRNMISTRFAMS
jgi:ribosome-binding ATPase YchF (GTP1/OBG family)